MRAVVARLGTLALVVVLVASGGALLAGLLTEGERGDAVVGSEFPVTPLDLARGYAHNSPLLVADPTEGRFVVMANRLDAPDFGCALQVSGDGGRTWAPANPVPKLPEGAEKCYAPEAAFDAGGTLYYLFVGLEGTGNQPMGAFLTTSTDRARTFSEPRRVLGPRNYAVRMALDRSGGGNGRLQLVWLHAGTDPPLGGFNAGPNPIQAAHSDDGGRTFSDPVTVAGAGAERVAAPALSLGPDGEVHVAFYDLQDDVRDYQGLEGPTWERTWAVRLASSTDGGSRFIEPVTVDDGIVPDERVILIFTMPPPALVAGDGRMCTAWTDARNGDPDAVVRCSTDGGRTWGPLRRLNDDGPGNGRTQYQPRLGLAPDGRLDAVFYDRRNDPDNVLNQVFYTYSTDGAATFTRNRLLTTDPSTTRVGQRYTNASAQGLVEFGSRMGLLSTDGDAVAAWTDTRNSRSGTSQVLFSSAVTFPEGSDPVWARVAGVGLLVAGLVLLVLAARPGLARRSGSGIDPSSAGSRYQNPSASRAWVGPAALLLLAGAGCSSSGPGGAPLPAAPSEVTVRMTEYRFDHPTPVASGRVVFRFENEGKLVHQPDLIVLSDNIPPILEQLRGEERAAVGQFAGIPPRNPGESGTYAVDLVPGQRYAFVCFATDPDDDESHALQGMATEFRAGGPSATTTTSG
jgi:hypothetical protein